MDKYGLYLVNKLMGDPFFKRFDAPTLHKYLRHGKPETFMKHDIIYLAGRVGVICYGSVKIVSHSRGLLTPHTEVRHLQGKIIGHESDDGISTNSQNWLFCYDEGTEILFFPYDIFNKLWLV